PHFHDMAAQHGDDGAASRRGGDRLGDGAQVTRGQYVGQGVPEGAEAGIAAGRMREEGGVDFVAALGDGNGLQPAEVRLAVIGHGCSVGGTENSFSFRVTVPNEKFDCSARIRCCGSSDNQMWASACSAKMPRPLGMIGRITMALNFFPATPTFSRFSTTTITGLRSGRK